MKLICTTQRLKIFICEAREQAGCVSTEPVHFTLLTSAQKTFM